MRRSEGVAACVEDGLLTGWWLTGTTLLWMRRGLAVLRIG